MVVVNAELLQKEKQGKWKARHVVHYGAKVNGNICSRKGRKWANRTGSAEKKTSCNRCLRQKYLEYGNRPTKLLTRIESTGQNKRINKI